MATRELIDGNGMMDFMERDFFNPRLNSYSTGPGSRMPVERQPSSKQTPDRILDPLKLYVSQIPLTLTDAGLRSYMSSIQCPMPNHLKLFRGQVEGTPCNNQCAFLTFENTRNASEALQLLHKREPYFFKANFANKTGDKQRKEKLLEEELKVRNVEHDFGDYLKLRRSQKVNQWQQCTTFNDDVDNEAVSETVDKPLVSMSISSNKKSSSLEELTLFELIRFLQSRNNVCEQCAIKPYVDHFHYIIDEAVVINPLESLPQLLELTCHGCKVVLKVAQKICVNCNVTTYCSKWCQMSDWKRHCNDCKSISKKL